MSRADLELLEAWAERWRIKWATTCGTRLAAMERGDYKLADECTAKLKELLEENIYKSIWAELPTKVN
jgi:hypothetical protein